MVFSCISHAEYYFWQEEEILDLLEQCEADENITFDKSGNRPMSKGPKVTAALKIAWVVVRHFISQGTTP